MSQTAHYYYKDISSSFVQVVQGACDAVWKYTWWLFYSRQLEHMKFKWYRGSEGSKLPYKTHSADPISSQIITAVKYLH